VGLTSRPTIQLSGLDPFPYGGSAFEVEFSGRDGRAYAVLPVTAEKLIALRESPESAAA
jgi:hypothetical protein